MGNTGSGQGEIFDIRKIRRLVELMKDHDLSEIDLQQQDQRIRIRRGPSAVASAAPPVAAPAPAAAAQSATAAEATTAKPASTAEEGQVIRSPMVGTFYTTPSPDQEAFVKIGDQVGPETVVCIVEAMKVFNEIQAECSGKIAAVLVENGDPVEYGQPLFRVAAGG